MRSYNGGKGASGTYQQIINQIPPHSIYVALMAGHDSIFRRKRPAAITILNDPDPGVIEAWKRYKMPGFEITMDFMQGNLFERSTKPVVILRNNDYRVILDRMMHNPEVFIFADPPYPMSTRTRQTALYNFEWETDKDHVDFLQAIRNAKCNVMISSYPNDLYNEHLHDWRSHTFQGMTRGGPRTEIIYMNYAKPVVLHDTQYLGNDYRERWDIKKKVERYDQKLKRMPEAERMAILSLIVKQYRDTTEKLILL